MKIRRYEPGDLAQITALFYDTVHACLLYTSTLPTT